MSDIKLPDLGITDDNLQNILQEIQQAWERKLLQLKHPYVIDLVKVLAPYNSRRRRYVLDELYRNRRDAGLPIPPRFEESTQRALEYHCRDSDVFKNRKVPETEALFCWPEGKGAGVWALIPENARSWVERNREILRERLRTHRV